MRIVSWNCNGALRNKLFALQTLNADLYIVQECENPAQCKSDAYQEWAQNYQWIGTTKNRGLGVFAKQDMKLDVVPLDMAFLELFLHCRVNDSISLLAVWIRKHKSSLLRYIGQLGQFLQSHQQFLSTDRVALIGDLNSNVCWDAANRAWSHSDAVSQLNHIGLTSLYHHTYNEPQGAESQPTFYMNRNLAKAYHIDYAFLSPQLLHGATCDIGSPTAWLSHSDHMPLIINSPHLW